MSGAAGKAAEWLNALSTAILVLVTGCYVFQNQQLLEISRQQLEATVPPIVAIEGPKFSQELSADGTHTLVVKNEGRTAVRSIRLAQDWLGIDPAGGSTRLLIVGGVLDVGYNSVAERLESGEKRLLTAVFPPAEEVERFKGTLFLRTILKGQRAVDGAPFALAKCFMFSPDGRFLGSELDRFPSAGIGEGPHDLFAVARLVCSSLDPPGIGDFPKAGVGS